MGPLFSLVFMAILASLLFSAVFAPSAHFLPERKAFLFAIVEVAALGVGGFAGMLIQSPFVAEELATTGEVLRYFGIVAASAGVAAVAAAFAFWKITTPANR